MFWGTIGAVIARIVLLFAGSLVITIPFVKLIAGAYLVYLAFTMLTAEEDTTSVKSSDSLFGAIKVIVLADIMMSLDNVIAVTSASQDTGNHALGYAVGGILFSIPVILFAAKGLTSLIDKFPVIEWIGASLIAYVGAEMLLKEGFISTLIDSSVLTSVLSLAITTISVGLAYFVSYVNKQESTT